MIDFAQFVKCSIVLFKTAKKNYLLGENVTIDEMLPGFRGRCAFRQYIPSKPNKYGIKVFALVDAKMIYTCNMEICTGKQPEGPFLVSNKPREVVKRIAEPLFETGRNITTDNWFTDIDLVNDLKKRGFLMLAQLKKIKDRYQTILSISQHSSLFRFNNGNTLVSYIPKKGKNVILVSSLHETNAIDQNTREQQKPEVITFYNTTKGGVDTTDQMCATFSVSWNTRCWLMVIFFACLNVAGINSQVISIANKLEPLKRRIFLKTLSHQLTIGQLAQRSLNTRGMPTHLQFRLKRFLPQEKPENITTIPPKRRKCAWLKQDLEG
ncbi:piggyBac transposable element-derived protein 4-like [Cimex lectularius]|uniref:PiggyBac transposable element-derived protein domain-containing protein n=1 Tax=Cimex lectularius TaxID=79782 RepID=A0A8I6SPU0_CIMLE|nr:piggyBac transposable element-derived protein 4-like [Cimex lectularius]